MKTLYIHRHAKAVKEGYDQDFSRNLRPRGIEEAHRMGRYLKHHGFIADAIVTSTANRALQTAQLISEHTGEGIHPSQRLYDQGWEALLEVIRALENGWSSVRIMGHNPDLEELCGSLCGIRSGGVRLATCGILCITCDILEWSELDKNTGVLEWSISPIHL